MASAATLVRVVRRSDGSLVVGRSLPGRGAWLCRDAPECVERAVSRKAFERAFRAPVEPGSTELLVAALGSRR